MGLLAPLWRLEGWKVCDTAGVWVEINPSGPSTFWCSFHGSFHGRVMTFVS